MGTMHASIPTPARPEECPAQAWFSIRHWRPLPAWAWLGYELLGVAVALVEMVALIVIFAGFSAGVDWLFWAAGFKAHISHLPAMTLADWGLLGAACTVLGCSANLLRQACRNRWPVPAVVCSHFLADHDQVLRLREVLEERPWMRHFVATQAGRRGDVAKWRRGDISWLLAIAGSCDAACWHARRLAESGYMSERTRERAARANARMETCRQMNLSIEGLRMAAAQTRALSSTAQPAARRRV